ncbi:Bifunctional arginine demethylase and lysyl-hydroxylase JMJD6 [Sarcoptes scabiei]|uniref:Bifunctional arginine demethylase and lysyl-hydroxylase JMJD6 n=1 Tax=Sarcoptes scabiei TaxID=52283 RepID=A0A834RAC2_SARSC|nr:Bifunctional arginine demethylase and lysyl-hydroxylase JMJD6 [Sarcoptes scabiei]
MKLRELALIESELERVRAEFENDSLVRSKQISFDDFYRMDSIREWNLDRNHSSKTRPSSLSFRYCCYFLVLILILAYLGRSIDFYSYRRRSQSNCLVPLPNYLQNAFVPAQDCRFCSEITEIKRERSISSEEFSKKYAYTKVPVIITDAQVNWTAQQIFNFDFFKNLYLNGDKNEKDGGSPLGGKNCQFFPYKTEFHSLKQAFRMDPHRANYSIETEPWYFGWSNCDHRIANKLRRHYGRPYFLPNDSESIRTDWIFMGTPNNGAHMHIDHVGRPSWQAQIHGTKRWFLEPPLECYADCSDLTVDVNEGEIIVLDTNVWYHKTLIVGDKISLTIGAEYD